MDLMTQGQEKDQNGKDQSTSTYKIRNKQMTHKTEEKMKFHQYHFLSLFQWVKFYIRSNTQHLWQCFHYLVQRLMLIINIDRVKINSLIKWWQLMNSYLFNFLSIVLWYQLFDSLQQRNIFTNPYQFIVIKIIMWSILLFFYFFFVFLSATTIFGFFMFAI